MLCYCDVELTYIIIGHGNIYNIWYHSIITSFYMHIYVWYHKKATMHSHYVFCVDHVFSWHGTYVHILFNLLCVVTRGLAMYWSSHVCNSHAKNMLRQIFNNALPQEYSKIILLLASMDKNGITLFFLMPSTLKT